MIHMSPTRLNGQTCISYLGTPLSLSLLLDVGKEAHSDHCHGQPLCDHEGPSLEMKSMRRMAVEKAITEFCP